jgi:hypothetical protein
MREEVILIMEQMRNGHGYTPHSAMNCPFVAIVVNPLDMPLRSLVAKWIVGVSRSNTTGRLVVEHQIRTITILLNSIYQS